MNKIFKILQTFLFIPISGKVYVLELIYFFKVKRPKKSITTLAILSILLIIYILVIDKLELSEESVRWIGTFILIFFGINYFNRFYYDIYENDLLYYFIGFGLSALLINDSFYFSNEGDLITRISGSFLFLTAYLTFTISNWLKFIFLFLSLIFALYLGDRLFLINIVLVAPFLVFRSGQNKRKVFAIIISSFVVIIFLGKGLIDLILSNFERLSSKSEQTILHGGNNLITYMLNSRPDILPMIYAIKENFLFGYGSNGGQEIESFIKYNPLYQQYTSYRFDQLIDRGVVLHSFVLGNWVRYGILGLVYCLFFLKLIIRTLKSFFANPALVNFMAIFCIITLFFEPGRNRLPFVLGYCLLMLYQKKIKIINIG